MNSWSQFLNEITPGDLSKERGDASRAAAIERLKKGEKFVQSTPQPTPQPSAVGEKLAGTDNISPSKPISQHDQTMALNKFKNTKIAGTDNTSITPAAHVSVANNDPQEHPTTKWGDLLNRGKSLASDAWDKTKEETSGLMHKKLGKIGDTDIEGSHAAAAGIAGLAAGAGALGLRKLLSKKK